MTGQGGAAAGSGRDARGSGWPHRAAARVRAVVLHAAGGPARARVVLTLAAVLGLSGADTATISATTGNLERAFGIGNTEIGLLVSVVAVTGAVFTVPVGVLTDRTRRTWLLAGSIVAWAVATGLSGAATSYWWLLLARVALGAVTATTGPTVASLVGDFFPAADRGRMYGLILGGDLVGSGIGFVASGDISSLTSWRVAFWWLVLPSLALAWLAWRLPEPARGGASRLPEGARHITGARDAAAPTLFGYVSQYVFGGPGSSAGGPGTAAAGGNGRALEYTFLVFLVPLLIAGLLALIGLRTYPRDVATATASVEATAGRSPAGRPAG